MAGSWGHLVGTHDEPVSIEEEGRPLRDEDGSFPLIENMGDAVEALEECYGMVWVLASRLSASLGTQGNRQAVLAIIEQANNDYRTGYLFGAGELPRW